MAEHAHQSDARDAPCCAGDGHRHGRDHGGCCSDGPAAATPRQRLRGRTFKISGMDCAEEVAVLKREIGPLVGGEERVAFDILKARMTVDDAPLTDRRRDPTAVASAPMRRSRAGAGSEEAMSAGVCRAGVATLGVICVRRWRVALARVDAGGHRRYGGPVSAPRGASHAARLSVPSPCTPSRSSRACGSCCRRPGSPPRMRPDMNLLMTSRSSARWRIGEWFEAATVAFLFSLSLAAWSRGASAARAARSPRCMDLSPPTARLHRRRRLRRSRSRRSRSPVGAAFLVSPASGSRSTASRRRRPSDVNQAPITGESVPGAPRRRGDEVFAGTINGDGALEIESTSAAGDTTLARIIRMVGEAQSRRGAVRAVGRAVRPRLHARRDGSLALAVLVVPPLLFGGAWSDVALPRAGAAGHRLPLRAGDLDAGEHRRRPRGGGAATAC